MGDIIGSYQDLIADEAHLNTARRRPGKRYTSVLLQEGRVVIDADWNEASGREVCGIYRERCSTTSTRC